MLTILETFYGLKADDPVTNGATTTAKQFARSVVRRPVANLAQEYGTGSVGWREAHCCAGGFDGFPLNAFGGCASTGIKAH